MCQQRLQGVRNVAQKLCSWERSLMSPNDADGMANNVDPDQTAPLWSGSALFAQTYLSENLGSLR